LSFDEDRNAMIRAAVPQAACQQFATDYSSAFS
jgi:hypothetical protein